MDQKFRELCIFRLKTDAVTTVQSPSPSTMSQLLLRSPRDFRDSEKGHSDQMSAPGSLADHHDVCPQALLSLGLSVCLFVSLKCFSERSEVPNFAYKNPGTINRNMKDRPGNAGRCFERIKRLETDGFAQWHGTFMSHAITLLPQLLYIRITSPAWEPSSQSHAIMNYTNCWWQYKSTLLFTAETSISIINKSIRAEKLILFDFQLRLWLTIMKSR